MRHLSLRRLLGLLFIVAGGVFILGATLFTAHLAINNYLAGHPIYLSASALSPTGFLNPAAEVARAAQPASDLAAPTLPASEQTAPTATQSSAQAQFLQPTLPSKAIIPTLQADPALPSEPIVPTIPLNPVLPPTETGDISYTQTSAGVSTAGVNAISTPEPTGVPILFPTETPPPPTDAAADNQQPVLSFPTPPPTATPTPTPPPTVTPEPAPVRPVYTGPDPVVRVSIPKLKVKRAVVEIGLQGDQNGSQEWDTDRLFNTQSRADLIGHLEGSAYPGEGGNVVLVGHNYTYTGSGVFVNLQKLKVGDKINLVTESDQEISYEVIKVKTVPYSGNQGELERHQRFLDPTPEEQLTLVTCGGVNVGFFNKRVYVVAVPVDQ